MKKTILLSLVTLITVSCQRDVVMNDNEALANLYHRDRLSSSHFTINPGEDTILYGQAGTEVCIEKNTFVDVSGSHVTGAIKIELKEAYACEDFVLGNLTTTSNDEILQSGGMMYFNATYANKDLGIAAGKSISISVPTDNRRDSMQIYSAEITSGNRINWVNPQNLITDMPEIDTTVSDDNSSLLTGLIQGSDSDTTFDSPYIIEQPEEPVKPRLYNPHSDTTLSLVFDTADFPEFTPYRNVKFRLAEPDSRIASKSKKIWMSMDLKKTDKEGIYQITFTGTEDDLNESISYQVSPAFEEGYDYETAMAEYEKKYMQYNLTKETIKAQEEKRQEEIRAANELIRRQEQLQMARMEAELRVAKEKERIQLKNNLIALKTRTKVLSVNASYTFSLRQLGWCNIDRRYEAGRDKINMITRVSNPGDYDYLYVTIVLNNKNIFLQGQVIQNTFNFSSGIEGTEYFNVGEQATILATGIRDGKLYFKGMKIKLKNQEKIILDLNESDKEKIKSEIKSLT